MKRRHSTMIVHDAYIEDALLIAAAPEMYKRSYELIEAFNRRELTPRHIDALRGARGQGGK